jgi:hypothetical protein
VSPMWDWDGRKYLELEFENKIIRVKIPFRYGRTMCRSEGLKTVHELKKGDVIEANIEKKVWDGENHWILISFREIMDD